MGRRISFDINHSQLDLPRYILHVDIFSCGSTLLLHYAWQVEGTAAQVLISHNTHIHPLTCVSLGYCMGSTVLSSLALSIVWIAGRILAIIAILFLYSVSPVSMI